MKLERPAYFFQLKPGIGVSVGVSLGEIGVFLGDACAILIKLFNPQRLTISGPAGHEMLPEQPQQTSLRSKLLIEILTKALDALLQFQPSAIVKHSQV